jgi:methylmalonyl-CoA mutase C-terminal domain/subunit
MTAGRIVLAKTSLDGHWRGLMAVARVLRDAGFEVIMLGQATAEQIVESAISEDADLVGLNVGGRIEVVERVLDGLEAKAPGLPVFCGGTVPPVAVRRLAARGVPSFPPGSSFTDIIDTAHRLIAVAGGTQ